MDFTFLNNVDPILVEAYHVEERSSLSLETKSYGKRTVSHYELDYITWGQGYIITDGKKYEARKGNLFFRKPGMVVEGFRPYNCYYIVFDMFKPEGVNPETGLSINGIGADERFMSSINSLPTVMYMDQDQELGELLQKLVDEYIMPGEASSFITRTYLMQILHFLYRQWITKGFARNGQRMHKSTFKQIFAVSEYIKNNAHQNFTLDELAKMSGFSRYFFCREFRELLGKSPIDFLIQCKLNMARKMLAGTGKSVTEIIEACGFENESHFYKLFKRYAGVTPLAFRRRYNYLA